jgi:hypothetical protein
MMASATTGATAVYLTAMACGILRGMDVFNIIVGIVAVFAAIFGVYTYMQSQREKAVETQKSAEYQQRLADLLSMANAIAKQATLAAVLSDREEVTKKEIKHLMLGQLATIESMQSSLTRIKAVESRWRFGMPSPYLEIEAAAPESGQPHAVPDSAAAAGS